MIYLPASVRVYVCLSPTDMRRSFDGLHALVRDHLQLDAFAGHLYIFSNRKKDRLKILYWNNDGFAIWAKRLEQGVFAIPLGEPGSTRLEITTEELGAVLSGIDLQQTTRLKGIAAVRRKTFLLPCVFSWKSAALPVFWRHARARDRS
jgi:transposase